MTWIMFWKRGSAGTQRWWHGVSLTEIPEPETSPKAVMDLSTEDQCSFFFFFPRRPPSTVSLRWKALTQPGLRAALWPFLNSCLALRRVREEANAWSTCVSTPSLVLETHPGFLFPEHHLATDASLYLRHFTMSGNVAARLFWGGRAASYLTDLPMKSQMHSISPQRHAKVILTTHGFKPPPSAQKDTFSIKGHHRTP